MKGGEVLELAVGANASKGYASRCPSFPLNEASFSVNGRGRREGIHPAVPAVNRRAH